MNIPPKLCSFLVAAALTVSRAETVLADSATWKTNAESGDWNAESNWSANGPPNGPADVATFDFSTTNSLFISADTEVNEIVFNPSAGGYKITSDEGFVLRISGVGITNNSGRIQTFVANGGNSGAIFLANNASAGNLTVFAINGGALLGASGGFMLLLDNSTASNSTLVNEGGLASLAFGGVIEFAGSSTAGNAVILNHGGGASFATGGSIQFTSNASAGKATFITDGGRGNSASGGTIRFDSASTAANGTFTTNGAAVSGASGGAIIFLDQTNAGHGVFTTNGGAVDAALGGTIEFHQSAAAVQGTFITNGGVPGAGGGTIEFFDKSMAGHATVINNGGMQANAGGGSTEFGFNSTAEEGIIINNGATAAGAFGGVTNFAHDSTADSATLIANSGSGGGAGGAIFFRDFSTGDRSRVEVFGNGSLTIAFHDGTGVTIGSLEGDGNVFLGSKILTVGGNDASTTFSGTIHDFDFGSAGPGGQLTKIGSGTLTLSGQNTFTGATTINDGKLIINGSIVSPVTVNGGMLGGSGTTGAITVNKNGALAPGSSAGILNANGNLKLSLGSTYLVDINGVAVGKEYDQANVIGVVTLEGASLSLHLGFTPVVGSQFTIINNDLNDMVNGTFDGLSEGATFVSGGRAFTISYHGGDGNDVVLNAVPEPQTWILVIAALIVLGIARKRIFIRGFD